MAPGHKRWNQGRVNGLVKESSPKSLQELKEHHKKLEGKLLMKDYELSFWERELTKEKKRKNHLKTTEIKINQLTNTVEQSQLVLRGLINERYELEQKLLKRLPAILRSWKRAFVSVQTEPMSKDVSSQASPVTEDKAVMTHKQPIKTVAEPNSSSLRGSFARS